MLLILISQNLPHVQILNSIDSIYRHVNMALIMVFVFIGIENIVEKRVAK